MKTGNILRRNTNKARRIAAPDEGFTLVELAIVMIIIGLLIGGVLKGQQLVQNARVTAVINAVNGYRAAYAAFKDTYGAVPGDMPNARLRIAGCTGTDAAGNYCYVGNGNGIVGTTTGSTGNRTSQANLTSTPQIETSMFWKHLALADLITGVENNANPAAAAWGRTHPSSPIGGGFVMMFATTTSGTPDSSHFLRLQNQLVGTHPVDYGIMPLTPRQAWQIDRKMDDGVPRTGYVIGDNFDGTSDTGAGVGCEGSAYQMLKEVKACIQLYRID